MRRSPLIRFELRNLHRPAKPGWLNREKILTCRLSVMFACGWDRLAAINTGRRRTLVVSQRWPVGPSSPKGSPSGTHHCRPLPATAQGAPFWSDIAIGLDLMFSKVQADSRLS